MALVWQGLNIYLYDYHSNSTVVNKTGKTFLSTGETGHAKKVVTAIQVCIGASFGIGKSFIPVCSKNSSNAYY